MVDKPKGDIRDLYAYYRFSDHASTNVSLRGKSLGKSDVWFEGHMNWAFASCTFSKSFYFGVEGQRLQEDTRGGTGSTVAFPPYGSNGLTFEDCTFSESFEIKKNCVVVFKDCTFNIDGEITFEDNVRVELIDCTVNAQINVKQGCDIRARNSTFNHDSWCFNVEESCRLQFDECSWGNPEQWLIKAVDDCRVLIAGGGTLSCSGDVLIIEDSSLLKFSNGQSIISSNGTAITAIDSKIEVHSCESVLSSNADAVVSNNSELLFDSMNTIHSDQGSALALIDSVVRFRDLVAISSSIGNGITAQNSKIYGDTAETISTGRGIAIDIESCQLEIHNIPAITSGEGTAIKIYGGNRSVFRNVSRITVGEGTALDISGTPEVLIDTTTEISSGQGIAVVISGGSLQGMSVATITALVTAIQASNCTLRLQDVSSINCAEGDAVVLTGVLYEFKNVVDITSAIGFAFIATSCRGLAKNITTISAPLSTAVSINDISGPTDWDTVSSITSEQSTAFSFSGNAVQFRLAAIQNISTQQGTAFTWTQSGGVASIYDCGSITTQEGTAAQINVTEGAQLEIRVLEEISTQQGTVLDLTCGGRVGLHSIDSLTTPQGDVFKIAVLEGGILEAYKVADLSTEQGNAVSGSCEGIFTFQEGDSITTQQGAIIEIDCSSNEDSHVRFSDIGELSSQQASGDGVSITGAAKAQLYRIPSIEINQGSGYAVKLSGLSDGHGLLEVIDCYNITMQQGEGGVSFEDAETSRLVGKSRDISVTVNKGSGDVLKVTNTDCLARNISSLEADSGDGYGVFFSSSGGHTLRLVDVQSIKHKSGAKFTGKGLVELLKVSTIEGVKEDGIEVADGMEARVLSDLTITAASDERIALRVTGSTRNNYFNKLTASVGKLDINQSYARLSDATFSAGSVTITQSEVDLDSFVSMREFTVVSSRVDCRNIEVTGNYDFNVDNQSVFNMYGGTLDGIESLFVTDGAVNLYNVIINKELSGSNDTGSVTGSKVRARKVQTGSALLINDFYVSSSFQTNRPVLVNKGEFRQGVFLNDSTAFFVNAMEGEGSVDGVDANAVFVNRFELEGEDSNLSSGYDCAGFFNWITVPGYLDMNQNSGTFINRGVIEAYLGVAAYSGLFANKVDAEDFFPDGTELQYGGTGVVFVRARFDDSGQCKVWPGTGVLAAWLKGGDLDFHDSDDNFEPFTDPLGGWFNGIKGLIAGYSHFKGDITMQGGCAAIFTGSTKEGDFLIPEYASVLELEGLNYEQASGNGAAISLGVNPIMRMDGFTSMKTFIGVRGYRSSPFEQIDRIILNTTYDQIFMGTGTGDKDIVVKARTGGQIKRDPSSANWDI